MRVRRARRAIVLVARHGSNRSARRGPLLAAYGLWSQRRLGANCVSVRGGCARHLDRRTDSARRVPSQPSAARHRAVAVKPARASSATSPPSINNGNKTITPPTIEPGIRSFAVYCRVVSARATAFPALSVVDNGDTSNVPGCQSVDGAGVSVALEPGFPSRSAPWVLTHGGRRRNPLRRDNRHERPGRNGTRLSKNRWGAAWCLRDEPRSCAAHRQKQTRDRCLNERTDFHLEAPRVGSGER